VRRDPGVTRQGRRGRRSAARYHLARVLAVPDHGRPPTLRGSVTAYGPGGTSFRPIEFLEQPG
jgi:hypothetical protein